MRDIPPGVRNKVYGKEYVSTQFVIQGNVHTNRTFTAEELRQRPRKTIEGVPIVCGSGKLKQESHTYAGVLLKDLLDEAGVIIKEHEDPNRTYILAKSKDGYSALFSWHEIFNNSAGDGLLVALEKDGQSLDDTEGELCLIPTRDERSGPRRVRYLDTVEVRSVEA
jgi:hypothetical protein